MKTATKKKSPAKAKPKAPRNGALPPFGTLLEVIDRLPGLASYAPFQSGCELRRVIPEAQTEPLGGNFHDAEFTPHAWILPHW